MVRASVRRARLVKRTQAFICASPAILLCSLPSSVLAQAAAAQELFPGGPAIARQRLLHYGLGSMAAIVVLLAGFLLLRGRIRIQNGWAGRTITRFSSFERFTHWLLAVSFLGLAVTGCNALYGRDVVLPVVVGGEVFAVITAAGQRLHLYLALPFMMALGVAFLIWVRHSFPGWRDVVWLAKAGGALSRTSHPPAWKFDAGQKIMFWLLVVCGLLLSLSGAAMLFPAETRVFARIFAAANLVVSLAGHPANLPTSLTPLQETQFAAIWHTIATFALLVPVIVHVIIRTVGLEGAFSAMGSGRVDVNWAKQHHSLWADREIKKMEQVAAAETVAARMAPAE
jgi:formate dehydrogenase subunit gamma